MPSWPLAGARGTPGWTNGDRLVTAASSTPQTVIGHYTVASLCGDREERERLRELLNGGSRTGWNYDEAAMGLAVCQVALDMAYPEGAAEVDIRKLEDELGPLVRRREPDGYVTRVVREALGQIEDDLRPAGSAFAVRLLVAQGRRPGSGFDP